MAQGAALSAEVLFGGRNYTDAELSMKFDSFLGKVDGMPTKELSRDEYLQFRNGGGVDFTAQPRNPLEAITKTLEAQISKGLSADSVASIQAALAAAKATSPDLVKDFNLTTPIPSGAVAFDLESPMKELAPKPTPLRNRIPRARGVGTSHRFKTLTGFTGSGTGGVGVVHPGISDSTQTNFAPAGASNALYYARGPKISYAGSDTNLPYMQFSLSDEVTWSAQFAGQGFQDIRQVSRTHLLWASMLMEERMMLYSRGTNAAYSGVLAAPTIGTATPRTAASTESAISGATTNIYVKIVAECGDWGVGQASAAVSSAVAAGQVVDVTYTLPAGATGARAFVSTGASDPGDASRWLIVGANSRSGYATFTVQGALPTSGNSVAAYTTAAGAVVNLATTDGGTAFTNGYDGIWSYCTGPNSGYNSAINGKFSIANPGVEYQNAFASMFDAVKADPDRILMNGRDRKQLSDALKSTSGGPYQLKLTQDDITGVTMGAVVGSIINEVTGKTNVQLEVHPWMPQGNSAILSDTLPIPDTQVSNVWSVPNVQDYMGMDWPVNQFAYESSSYWFGTLVCYAPPWNGAVRGIQLG